jgi:hypothetical protein
MQLRSGRSVDASTSRKSTHSMDMRRNSRNHEEFDERRRYQAEQTAIESGIYTSEAEIIEEKKKHIYATIRHKIHAIEYQRINKDKYSFYELIKYIPIKRYKKTVDILDTLYKLKKEKIQIIISLSKLNLAYKNNKYQIEHLINLKLYVKSLFDCAFGDQLFGIKIIPIVKANINNSKTTNNKSNIVNQIIISKMWSILSIYSELYQFLHQRIEIIILSII